MIGVHTQRSALLALALLLAGWSLLACTRIEPGAPDGAIRVQVLDPSGEPLPGVSVAIRSTRELPPKLRQGAISLRSWGTVEDRSTDANGEFLFEHLKPGLYRVAAGAPPNWSFHFSEPTVRGERVTVQLSPYPRGRAIAGVVLDPAGLPVPLARLTFVYADGDELIPQATTADLAGRFEFLAAKDEISGALHAGAREQEFRSAVLPAVTAGNRSLRIQLRKQRYLTFAIHDEQERTIEGAGVNLARDVGGFQLWQRKRMPPANNGVARCELPDGPFSVTVSAVGYESLALGPLDPTTVDSHMKVELKKAPSLTGRVVHAGEPVAGADVSFSTSSGPQHAWKRTDQAGQFEFPFQAHENFSFRAWHDEHGEGTLERNSVSPEDFIEIELTRAPGSIAGSVHLPPGHEPHEVLLTTSKRGGYMRLNPDGSFLLPNLPPGPLQIYVRSSGSTAASTTYQRDSKSGWIQMSHGPLMGPDWLIVEPSFFAAVHSGETRTRNIDLVALGACRLHGRLLIDGKPLGEQPELSFMFLSAEPRITLASLDETGYESRTGISANGSFELRSERPGLYGLEMRLHLKAPGGSKEDTVTWNLHDEVELRLGSNSWSHDIATGSLTLLPPLGAKQFRSFEGQLRWQDSHKLEIEVHNFSPTRRQVESASFRRVPAGRIQVAEGYYTPAVILETHVEPNAERRIHLPADRD